MINATLCTTNNNEPWAANVNFEMDGISCSTSLKTKYAHYVNLQTNKNVVIVYKNGDSELIIKALADTAELSEEEAKVVFKVTWLRFVKDGVVIDFEDESDIVSTLNSLSL